MKTKKLAPKLTLNKETVSNLDAQQMNDVKGGSIGVICQSFWACPFTYNPVACFETAACPNNNTDVCL